MTDALFAGVFIVLVFIAIDWDLTPLDILCTILAKLKR